MQAILEQLHRDSRLATICRGRDDWMYAYIEGVGAEVVMLHTITSSAIMSGFTLIEADSITDVSWGTRRLDGLQRATTYDAISRREAPKLDLSGMQEALTGVLAEEKVVSIHREGLGDGVIVCMQALIEDGVIVGEMIERDGVKSGRVACCVGHVTRVDFGGPYERALQRMVESRDI